MPSPHLLPLHLPIIRGGRTISGKIRFILLRRTVRMASRWLQSLSGDGPEALCLRINEMLASADSLSLMAPSYPISRDQFFQIDADTFFRVAGVLPNDMVSGQYFTSSPSNSTLLAPSRDADGNLISSPRGAGFSSLLPMNRWTAHSQAMTRVLAAPILSG